MINPVNPKKISLKTSFKKWLPWLDILALLTWGILFCKYWLTGQLKLLIHPNYIPLAAIAGILLLFIAGLKIAQIDRQRGNKAASNPSDSIEHITLFPVGWGSSLLIITAVLGLIISPQVLTSQAALQRGISESLPLLREQTQLFRIDSNSEERTIVDWVRTLNAYPEPDAYTGQKAKFSGFVVHLNELPEKYIVLSRFIITCCAVDAYPVGIPLKLPQNRSNYPADTWLQVEGTMTTENLPITSQNTEEKGENKRQLVLNTTTIVKIPTPKDPYDYAQN
jgi:putative membrane protein